MAILTVASYFQKGSPVRITVSKSELLELVDSDYFEDMDHWNKIILKYKSTTGQFEKIICDAVAAIPSAYFKISPKADDVFQISQIVIMDFDGKIYVIDRTIIPESISLDFNYAQTAEADYTFFAKTGGYTALMDVSNDEKTIVVQNAQASNYNIKPYYNLVLENLTSNVNEQLTYFINFQHVESYYFTDDFSHVYVSGRFGNSFLNTALPEITPVVDASYNLQRIVKINVATKEGVHIGDIPYSGNDPRFDIVHTMIEDPESDVLLALTGNKIFGFKISTRQLLWFKNYSYLDNARVRRKVYLYTSGSFLLGHLSTYDNVTFTYNRPIKVNILTGNIDESFPVCPAATFPNYSPSNGANWSMTPDKTKIVQAGIEAVGNFFVFENGSWSLKQPAESPFYVTMMDVSNTHVYLQTMRYDFNGVKDTSYTNLSVDFYWAYPTNLLYAGDKLYSYGVRFNSNTGGFYDKTFSMSASNGAFIELGYKNNFVFYGRNSDSIFNCLFYGKDWEYHYGGRVAVIDADTKELKYSFTATYQNPSQSQKIRLGGLNNNKFFPIGTYVDTTNNVKTITETVSISDTSFPRVSSSGSFGGGDIDGEYLYLMSNYINTPNTFTITQTSGIHVGTHTINSKLCRINHITEETDITFAPAIPDSFGGDPVISFTENYIYIWGQWNGYPSTFYRINKTTQAVQEITPQTLGLTSPASFSTYLGQLKAAPAGSGKVAIYGNSNNDLKLDGRPYVKFDEASLTKTEDQPATWNYRAYNVIYNPKTNQLAGFFREPTLAFNNLIFATFNLETNQKIVHDTFTENVGYGLGNNFIPENFLEGYSSATYYTIETFKDSYLMHTNSLYTKKHRPFVGIIKLPLLT